MSPSPLRTSTHCGALHRNRIRLDASALRAMRNRYGRGTPQDMRSEPQALRQPLVTFPDDLPCILATVPARLESVASPRIGGPAVTETTAGPRLPAFLDGKRYHRQARWWIHPPHQERVGGEAQLYESGQVGAQLSFGGDGFERHWAQGVADLDAALLSPGDGCAIDLEAVPTFALMFVITAAATDVRAGCALRSPGRAHLRCLLLPAHASVAHAVLASTPSRRLENAVVDRAPWATCRLGYAAITSRLLGGAR